MRTMAEADPTLPSLSNMQSDHPSGLRLDKAYLRSRHIVGHLGNDSRSRPFNLWRTRLVKEADERGARLIGLTSPTPAAGKSYLALNLAASLARLGERPIVLVDLDLRRASLADLLDLDIEAGVGDFLSGDIARLQDIGWVVNDLPLTLYPTRAVHSDSAELISRESFSVLLELLRNQAPNALVLFDLAPVFASDDTMIAVESLDGYMLVAEAGRTNRSQVAESLEMLQPTPCLGTVLNRYQGGMLDSYGYGSSAYERYYEV